jgi:hypothetical protein
MAKTSLHHQIKSAQHKAAKTVNLNFWKKAAYSLHPKSYAELSSRKIRDGPKYLLSILFAAFIIMSIIFIPKVLSMDDYISSELSKFELLNINISEEMSSPIEMPEKNPQIIIDTADSSREMGNEKILIAGSSLYFRPYGKVREYNLSEFKDITSKKDETSGLLTFFAILLIPTILITSYVMFFVKYVVTILVGALLLFIGLRLAKKDLSILRLLNIAVYASTPMVLIEVISIPFNSNYLVQVFQVMGINFYLVTLLIYIVFASVCAYLTAGKKKEKKKGYATMEEVEWEF